MFFILSMKIYYVTIEKEDMTDGVVTSQCKADRLLSNSVQTKFTKYIINSRA